MDDAIFDKPPNAKRKPFGEEPLELLGDQNGRSQRGTAYTSATISASGRSRIRTLFGSRSQSLERG